MITRGKGDGARPGSGRRGGRRSVSEPPRAPRRWFLLLVLMGLLAPAAALAGNMEGPLEGGRQRGASDPEDYRLERVRFENDGEWLRMAIPIKAPWAHWTLANPPRIIVDLGQTTSHLPNAPGLYQARLDRGPVRALRTSQFLYSPLDHRVRLTLDLTEVVPYEARRVGDEIQILIPDRQLRTPRAVVIGPTGIAGVSIESARPEQSLPLSTGDTGASARSTGFGETSASAGSAAFGETDASAGRSSFGEAVASAGSMPLGFLPPSVTPRPDAIPSEAAEGGTTRPGENPAPAPGSPPEAGYPASTLREALAAFSGIGIEPVEEDTDDLPASAPQLAAALSNGAAVRPGSMTRQSPKASVSKPAAASVREAPPSVEDVEDPLPDPVPASDPKERSAARLLRQAVLAALRDDLATAAAIAERAYRFYAGTESGNQCGLLARELYLLLGRPADARGILGLTAFPDTTRLPRALYVSFVEQHRRAREPAEVDRLLREWGPVYGPLPGLGALQYAIGEAFMRAGDAEAAERHLRLVPAGDSLEVPALLLIAAVEDRRGQREAALETYRAVIARGPGPFQARGMARTADLEFQLGRVREALASYERLLQSNPPTDEEVWGVYQAGNCHLLLGESTLARERYETVTKLWPRSFWAPFAKERLEEMTWRAHWASGIAAQ